MGISVEPNKTLLNELLALLEAARTPEEIQAVNQRLTEYESGREAPRTDMGNGSSGNGIAVAAASDDEDEDDDVGDYTSEIARKRRKTEESQEIGPLPEPKDVQRRESCRYDLRKYVLTYFSSSCWKGLSPAQEEMIAAFQAVILNGGKKARAVRRSGLKSTLARLATAWAVMYGHRRFVVLVGSVSDAAERQREHFIKTLFESSLHTADFPELLPLFFKDANPKKGIVLNGEQQLDVTTKDSRGCIVFPRYDKVDNLHGKDCSQCHIAPYSIQTSGVRGLSFEAPGGGAIRPDLLIFDDVQSDMTALSVPLTDKLENRICTTFMGLVALGESIASIMVCTVHQEDDLSLRFCDRKRHPDWDGQTFPVLLKEPDGIEAKRHWASYREKLLEGATFEEGFAVATAYYLEHRTAMDEGGLAAWESDKDRGYVSSIQWCMTTSMVNPELFRCELQQKGARPKGDATQLVATQLLRRMSGIPRGVVPSRATYLTAFVDSQDHYLFWVVCAWMTDMTGWIVDWGTWPDQKRVHFYRRDILPGSGLSLEDQLPDVGWEEAFTNAHNHLDAELLSRQWLREDGGTATIDMLLKDWSDGAHMRRLEPQILASPFRDRIRPAKGIPIRPGGKPIHRYGDDRLDRHCKGCWIERRTSKPYHLQVDTDMAKGITARRLQTVFGAPSSLLFPGEDESDIMMLVEHITAEKANDISVNGIHGIHYDKIAGRDNEGWDCVVGNLVAASLLGCAVPGDTVVKVRRTGPRKTLAEVMGLNS